ncbi:MAG: hypothetical protein QM811_08605 [Pirellulales bacterium]
MLVTGDAVPFTKFPITNVAVLNEPVPLNAVALPTPVIVATCDWRFDGKFTVLLAGIRTSAPSATPKLPEADGLTGFPTVLFAAALPPAEAMTLTVLVDVPVAA